jgi:hypothetical protein
MGWLILPNTKKKSGDDACWEREQHDKVTMDSLIFVTAKPDIFTVTLSLDLKSDIQAIPLSYTAQPITPGDE